MKVDLVICSDLHLRSDTPRCRKENEFQEAQLNKLNQIKDVANKHQCPTVIAGDIGHTPAKTWSVGLLSRVICIFREFEKSVYVIPGQHDLPNHNPDNAEHSGFGVLMSAGVLTALVFNDDPMYHCGSNNAKAFIHGFLYGTNITNHKEYESEEHCRYVAVIHQMVLQDKPLWPGQTDIKAKALLKKYNYDLIISGDNHHSFMVQYKNKLLINPGSMMRQNSSQIDFKPRIYLWNAETNTAKEHFLNIKEDVVSTEFVDKEKDKENRMTSLVQSLTDDTKEYETGLDFDKNVDIHIKVNKIEKPIATKMEESVVEGRNQ